MNEQFTQTAVPARRFDVMLSPTPRGARLARLLGKAWLRAWGLPSEVADAAEQVVAELATNAATHARVPGRSFLLVLIATPGTLRVEVTDTRGEDLPVLAPQLAPGSSESGRGLFLVDALADRWGVEEGPAPRKTIWAELDLVPLPRGPIDVGAEPRHVTARSTLTTPLTLVPATVPAEVPDDSSHMRRTATNRAALVVIDMQNGFVDDHTRHLVPKVVDLVDAWTRTGRPVVFTRYQNYPGSPYERHIGWTRLQQPPETEIVPELAEQADRSLAVIDKKAYSFFTAEADSLVASRSWTDLVFCGIATDCCVLKSAVDAFERGFTPWIVTDACASDGGAAAHDAGLLIAARTVGTGQLVTRSDALQRFAMEVTSGVPAH